MTWPPEVEDDLREALRLIERAHERARSIGYAGAYPAHMERDVRRISQAEKATARAVQCVSTISIRGEG